jgi:hypothetical protein
MNLWELQTVLALVSSTLATASHLYHPWGSMAALCLSSVNLFCYNLVDTALGWTHYWQKDRVTLVHHGGVTAFSLFVLHFHERLAYPQEIERIVRWGMLAEVTSIFNNLRILARKTVIAKHMQAIFAAVFLLLRTVMTAGCYYDLHQNRYFGIMAPFVFFISVLNLHWSRLIVRKIAASPEQPPSESAQKEERRCRSHFWEHYLLLGVPLWSLYTMLALPPAAVLPQIMRHAKYGGALAALGFSWHRRQIMNVTTSLKGKNT